MNYLQNLLKSIKLEFDLNQKQGFMVLELA